MSTQTDGLLRKLDELNARFGQIETLLQDPAVASDPARSIPLSKEQRKLRDLVERYRDYKRCENGIQEAEALLGDDQADSELRDLAREEIEQLGQRRDALLDRIKDTLVMADDSAIDSIILEIRPGTGGDEASLFARDLHAMYMKYAERKGWKTEVLSFSATEIGGLREVIVNVRGPGVWAHLGYEGGGHRVQRVPETESQGRIHTSAATVAVLPEPEEIEVEIRPDDVIEHVSRAGGPGGQNVNKVSSAIKLEHIPTGITVSMRDEKSQHKNRAKAWRILRSRVYDHHQRQVTAERDSARKTMIGSGDRSERIRTYNFPQNRLTDHRINLSLYSLDRIILGDMDELIDALIAHDKAERLKSL